MINNRTMISIKLSRLVLGELNITYLKTEVPVHLNILDPSKCSAFFLYVYICNVYVWSGVEENNEAFCGILHIK